jgi:hypothetical protein
LGHREKCKSDRYPSLLTHHWVSSLKLRSKYILLACALFIASSPHQLISSAHFCSECNSERNVRLWFGLVRRRQGHFAAATSQKEKPYLSERKAEIQENVHNDKETRPPAYAALNVNCDDDSLAVDGDKVPGDVKPTTQP